METQFRKVLCSERLPDRHIRHRKISITVPVFDIKDEFLGGDAYNFEFGHWIENQPEFRRGGIVNYWLEELYRLTADSIHAAYTKPVREERIKELWNEFSESDEFINSFSYVFIRGFKVALKEIRMQQRQVKQIEAQPREVLDKCNCPICDSDDVFSFQQTHYKCRSCDYRFTK